MITVDKVMEILQNSENKLCIFGAGKVGRKHANKLAEMFQISIDYFCDNNSNLWNKEIGGIKCISPEFITENDIVIIMIGNEDICNSVKNDLLKRNIKYVVSINEIVSSDFAIKYLFGMDIKKICSKLDYEKTEIYEKMEIVKNDKIAIYTCVTGEYDSVNEPIVIEDNCDYYYISEKAPNNLKVYKWLDVNEIVPGNITDNVLRNRYCKMFGNKIFKDYKYSVYIDGNCTLNGNTRYYTKYIGYSGLAMYKHEARDCIYSEGVAICMSKNIDSKILSKQLERYVLEGMPRHYGMFNAGVIIRDNTNEIAKQLTELWYEEFESGVRRDQISLTYVMWKMGLHNEDVGYIEDGKAKWEGTMVTANHHL